MNLRLQLGTLSVTSVSELLALNGYRALNQRKSLANLGAVTCAAAARIH